MLKYMGVLQDWHQKLHNNTTPDDVPICEAFIAFLEAKGDNGTYWRILSDAGDICNLGMQARNSRRCERGVRLSQMPFGASSPVHGWFHCRWPAHHIKASWHEQHSRVLAWHRLKQLNF